MNFFKNKKAAVYLAVFITLSLFFISACGRSGNLFKGWEYGSSNQLKIVFLDVGQGDATFIQARGGKTVLIDAGPAGAGKIAIIPFLKNIGVTKIDYFFITHPHDDHISGVIEIFEDEEITVENLIDCGLDHSSYIYRDILRATKRDKNIKYSLAEEGKTYILDDKGEIKLHTIQAWSQTNYSNVNEASTVLRVEFKGFSALITGDAEQSGEYRLLSKYKGQIQSTVLRTGHHGSSTSSIAPFLNEVQPRHAIISAGRYNSYNHPTPSVVSRLKSSGINIFRTDYHGNIMFVTDGEKIKIAYDGDFSEEKKNQVTAIDREAWALAQSNDEADVKKSVDLFKEGLKLDDSYVNFYSKLGYAYLKLNKFKEAAEILEKGKKIEPYHFHINNSLIDVYEKMGDDEKLKEQLEYFINLRLPAWERNRRREDIEAARRKLRSLN